MCVRFPHALIWIFDCIIHASCMLISSSSLLLVSCVGSRAMWAEDGHRTVPAGGSGGGVGEEREFLQEQCSPPVALHHFWPPPARSQEVLRQILHRVSGSHQWVTNDCAEWTVLYCEPGLVLIWNAPVTAERISNQLIDQLKFNLQHLFYLYCVLIYACRAFGASVHMWFALSHKVPKRFESIGFMTQAQVSTT